MKNLFSIKTLSLILLMSISLLSSANTYKRKNPLVFNQGFGVAYYASGPFFNIYSSSKKYGLINMGVKKGKFECIHQMRLNYKGFFAISNTSIFVNKAPKGFVFNPTLADFKIDLGYNVGKFKLSLGHQCLHAIEVMSSRDENRVSGGYNRIKITYNIK